MLWSGFHWWIELSQHDTAWRKNKIKLDEATRKAETCSAQLAEYNSLLEELSKEQEILIKEKEEFTTLKQKTLAVFVASENCIIENNKYKVQQTKLEEENLRLLSEDYEMKAKVVKSINEQLKNDLAELKTSSDSFLRLETDKRSQVESELSEAKSKFGHFESELGEAKFMLKYAESSMSEIESKFRESEKMVIESRC